MTQHSESLYSAGQGVVSSADFQPVIETRDPTLYDSKFPLGKRWINPVDNTEWVLTSLSSSGGTITANWTITTSSGGGTAPISKFIVDGNGSADYTTIASAIAAANAAGGNATVYVRPGVYTENLTLVSTIDVVGATGYGPYAGVTLTGVHTPPDSGRVVLDNMNLTSATHILNSSAAGSASLVITNCNVNCTSGYAFNVPNWTGTLETFDVNTVSTTDGGVNNTGGATVYLFNSGIGAGTGNSMILSGTTIIDNSIIGCPVNFVTGASFTSYYNQYNHTVTLSNNSTGTFNFDFFTTGATAALTMSSSATVSVSDVTITSSNNPVISGAGAGTLKLGTLSFGSAKNLASTLTLSYLPVVARITPYVVGPSGNYNTIQAALDAANAAGGNATVFLQPGTYTENLTLYTTVDIQGDSYSGCTITGVHTPPASGRVLFQSLTLTSATHIFSSAVAGSATIAVDNCEVVVTNGFLFNVANWTGPILVFDTGASGTNDGFVNNTGGSLIYVIASEIGSGSGQTMITTGSVSLYHVEVQCPANFQTGTTLSALGCFLQQAITFSNNSTGTITDSRFSTGSSASITQSSSGSVTLADVSINSSANPCIAGAGAGTLTLGSVTFLNNSATAGTLTLAYGTASAGTLKSTGLITWSGGQVVPVTNVNHAATPYALLATDLFVAVDPTAGVVTVTLPASPTTGRHITVYDATGQAGANTITVDGNGKNISAAGTSASTKTLTTAYSSLNLWYNGTIWNAQKIT